MRSADHGPKEAKAAAPLHVSVGFWATRKARSCACSILLLLFLLTLTKLSAWQPLSASSNAATVNAAHAVGRPTSTPAFKPAPPKAPGLAAASDAASDKVVLARGRCTRCT